MGAAGELVDPDTLRVCADPSNMPSSDESGDGFENKLAELVAEKTGRKSVAYTWFPDGHGLRPQHAAGPIAATSSWATPRATSWCRTPTPITGRPMCWSFRKGSGLDGVETIEDARLAGKRIGVVQATPPTSNMAAAKLMRTAKIYPLMVDTRADAFDGRDHDQRHLKGEIDAAMIWGPAAGYYIKKSGADLVTVPLIKEKTGSRMTYRITMGVRPSDQEWKRTLNQFIRDNQEEINKILLEYNVPLIDEQDNPITQ